MNQINFLGYDAKQTADLMLPSNEKIIKLARLVLGNAVKKLPHND